MAGHSRLKNGVASLAYVPAIHALLHFNANKDVDARHKAGHDVDGFLPNNYCGLNCATIGFQRTTSLAT